tara:strand:- start:1491 stop:4892 length:3402 start_codon:yes stop_codon:yes gene_type:complete
MGFWLIAALFVVSAGISYSGMQSAKKQAKKAAEAMAGVLVNKESNIEPLSVIYGTRRVGGVRVFVSTKDVSGGDKNEFLYIALALCEGEVNSITDIRIDDKPITDSQYSGLYTINVHLGADNQNYDPLLTEANAGWTSSHKLSGVAYLAIKLKWDADAFGGVPEITALVQGRKVYDPRSPSAANAYSDNPALCIRDYLTNARFGKGLPSSAIDDTAFSTAATDCDTSVTYYTNGTTGKIFQTHAVLQTDETIFSNIKIMLQGCRGFLPFTQGKYGLKIDKSSSSVYAFTTDTIIGGISVKGEEKKDKFNRVIVKFPNADVLYQPDQAVWPDAGSSEETAYLAQDSGTLLVQNLDLETVTNYYVARDLARVMLLRSRNSLRTSFRASSEAIQLSVGDVVNITHPTPAWTAKPFQIEEITLNYDGTCNINAVEYDPSIYTYDTSAQETVYPDTDLPNPFFVAPPRSLSATASTSVALDGTIVTSMNLAWLASLDSFVNQYDVQWSTDNTNFQSVVTDELRYVISPVESGATYYTRVRGINSLGVKSAFITANQGSVGDTTAPALPTSFSATAGYKSISLEWTNPSDKDFSNVEVYRATSSGGTFATVATVGGGFGANAEFLNGGLADATTFYYKFRSVDYSGNKTVDENGDPLYTAEVSATTNAAAINGTDGTNTAPVYAYKRSSSTLASTNKPTTSQTWTFADASFGDNDLGNGWTGDIPTGNDDLYICAAVASSTSTTDEVVAADWSAPQVLGTKGDDGTNGYNTAVVYGYKRSASTVTDKPDEDRVWTFSNGTWDSNDLGNSFTGTIPSGTNDLYVCTAVAASQSSTDTVTGTSDWGSPQLLASSGTDGAAGPRNAQGFLYYSVSGSQPSAPTATSFNFSTGDFSGLTADWSRTPPEITGADAAYWATSFTVVEATLDGSQTITFSTPFSSFAFNGLVTFSNLNDELADGTSGSEITTINGGLIKTGTMEADRIRIDGVGIDVVTSGTNKTLIIGNSGVTTVKLDNLAVTTLKIADQAVTIPTSTSLASSYTFNSTTASLVMTLTFTGSGAVAEVLGNFAAGGSGAPYLQLIYHLNDVEVRSRNYAYGGMEAFPITTLDGTNTIKVYARKYSSSGGTVIIAEGYVRTLETKK